MTTQVRAPEPLDRATVRVGMILVVGAFVALLDGTVVSVAVHTLAGAFSVGVADAQWVTTAYLLALAAVIPVTGWAARRFGASRAWAVSLGVMLVGSVLCGLAWSFGSLVAFRVVQGLGAGGLFPLSRIIVMEVAGRERLGRMMAVMALPVLAAPLLGPAVGGVVVEALSWRWVFLLNAPLLLAAIVLTLLFVPVSPRAAGERLDVPGLLCVSGGLTLLVYGLSGTGQRAVALVAGPVLLAAYGLREARSSRPGVVDLGLFRDRAFAASAAVGLLVNLTLFAGAFLVPLFFQQEAGHGALDAGLILVPQGLGMLVATLLAGRLVDASPRARTMVLAGLALTAVGTVPFALVEPGSHVPLGVAALFVRGVGLALAGSPIMKTLYHSLPEAKVPAATTANAVAQQLGGALGTAAVATALQRSGFHAAFWLVLTLLAVTAAGALLLPDRRLGEVSGPGR
ncbi:DHA2 family efflux MFS transporter permease subunit [Actinomadura kijaniata]|uniref:DHA2 family efflux MFS transporter permease subunit n=1 Tax=Actinomadura kijaniata TaxID=46161 RepID=UPI003F19DCE4